MHSYSSTAVLQESPTATLYRGVRAPDGCSVIIKALHPERLSRREVERLQHEYEVGQRLEGPYVLKPYALETFQGRPALVLEDFGGHPLTSLLGSPMETGRFLTLAVQLAAALASLHAQGIIHRDIKPDNLFVNLSTGQVKVSGFGLASPLPAWQQPLQPPALLEGTLAYMSPEQTGRMNRSVDQRSDLYSLGLTFYQMLAGAHPFQAGDPLEWVHCHLARTPQLLVERIPGLPPVLSRIVMRLLAKAAEDRYQIARGLRADLERCLEQWRTRGDIEPFALGAEDISDLLQIPPRLYGREAERVRLLAAFERVVARGRPVLALVHGPPGIGKTALVNELHRPLAGARERFLSGKFDQYKRDIPYSTLGQAFRALVLELLTGSEEQLAAWRERLRAVLGLNGRLLVELIPQLRLIVGEQPPVPELPLMEAQNRFHLVFRQFLEIFTREEHPLVLFLDDLQWADAASLELLRHVLTHADTHSLFVIGAYRDTEVGPVHPLRQMAEAVGREGGEIVDMALGPLSLEHLGQLLADTLRCPREEALPLARLIHERSAGNPFFATQLLTTLQREHLLEFDPRAARWKWDMERIRARSLADDVVDLLAEKLRRLPEATQEAVKLAACVGNSADVATLSVVSGRSEEEVHHSLWEAVREGVLLRQADRYQFLHDRVQQAAWSLIPGEERGRLHLRIGRLLLENTPREALAEHLFDIVNHLNQGATHLEDPREKERLAELDLLAGRKAKAATAYAAAAGYLAAGLAQLPPGSWETHYELTRELYLERVQSEYMDSRFEEAEALLAPLLSHAQGHVDKARILGEKLCLHELRGEYDRAVATARESLRLFGLELPPHPSWEQVLEEYARVQEGLRGRRTEELLDLPPMSDPEARAIMSVLVALINPAMYTDWRLLCLILCHGVELSLRYGNADSSCMVYVFFGMVLCAHFGRYQEGYRFGQLGYELVETRGLVGLRARVLLGFGYCINPWTRPLETSGDILQRAFVAAVETG
ncbi:MAG: serine/threonine-protein kinase PknK, partial [Myxococcaceae bacterium]|nr:serine/threonine-protein kinase PknK [Myxococcaceae bacterium]